MMLILGVLAWILINVYITLAAFAFTIPTFGESLFTGTVWHKLLGVVIWALVFYSWFCFLSKFTITLTP